MTDEAIIEISTIVDNDAEKFNKRLAEQIGKLQEKGLLVDMKFSATPSQLAVIVIGKRKNGYSSI